MGYHIHINFSFTHLKKVVILVFKRHSPKNQTFPVFCVFDVFPPTVFQSGQFIINPYPNLRPFWGTLPLLFTTIWGDLFGGKGRYKLASPIPVLLLVLQKLQSSHGPRRSSLEVSPYSNPLTGSVFLSGASNFGGFQKP